MNSDWETSEWFNEWLTLARKEYQGEASIEPLRYNIPSNPDKSDQ